jgi:hypothetical protein
LLQGGLFHRGRRFQTHAEAGETKPAEDVSRAMNRKNTFSAFGGEHDELDLPAPDEVDRVLLIAAVVHARVSRDFDGTGVHCLALQRATQLFFNREQLCDFADTFSKQGRCNPNPPFCFALKPSIAIDPLHRVLQCKLIGFVFGPEDYVETITMRWRTARITVGALARQDIPGNPAAALGYLKRLSANEAVLVRQAWFHDCSF